MERDAKLRAAEDVMVRRAFAVQPDQDLLKVAKKLMKKGWSGAPVVDESKRVVGMLSEHDLMSALAVSAFHEAPTPQRVADVMTQPASTVTVTTPLFDMVPMLSKGLKRVPVVHHDGTLAGIITRKDLVRALLTIASERARSPRKGTYDKWAEAEGSTNPIG